MEREERRGDGNGLTAASSLSEGQITVPASQTHLQLHQ